MAKAKEWNIMYRGNRWIGRRPCRWMPKGAVTFFILTRDVKYAMAVRPFKGMCITSAWLRSKPEMGVAGALLWRREYPSMKRVKKDCPNLAKHLAALETELLREHLAIVEHCACLMYEDGEPRTPGWFTVRTTGAAWQCTVKDPDSKMAFTTVGKTIDEAIGSAALFLACEEAPWEPDPWLAASDARKKKK